MELVAALSILGLAMLGIGAGALLGRPPSGGCGTAEGCSACPRRRAQPDGGEP